MERERGVGDVFGEVRVCVLTFGRGGGPLVVDLSAWVVERFEIT